MYPTYRTRHITCVASATQTLPELAVAVLNVQLITGVATPALDSDVTYAVVTGTPTGSQAQFTGTVYAPSDSLTFPSALATTDAIVVEYVPVGAL